ncbi:MAG: FAD-dependent oxidoreductase [Gemmatimonadaceae bacterium]|nr:FAD-dependent oxidoreductase [Gemmatimonadaceae bacterium]
MERHVTRTLVIGSGVAGLHTAWRCAEQGPVLLMTKRTLRDSNTMWAQGGIAAALGSGDSPALHWRDTLAAGGALTDAEAVRVLVTEGPERVRELFDAGAQFDLRADGSLKLGKEAAHSRRRIVHAHGDQTGAEVVRTLVDQVYLSPNVRILETARVLDLVLHEGRCIGVRAAVDGAPVEVYAQAIVLATGGCGQVFRYTTNPVVATGDGFAIAHRAGATIADIMPAKHKAAELAPRDVVAREIFRAQQRTGRVFLDARAIADFDRRFPGIFRLCSARGIDPRTDLVPVTPAAHYMMGGVVTDLAGRTTIPGLYACGEVACTGVHGSNRLASNSLLEGLVFAERVARDIAAVPAREVTPPPATAWAVPELVDRGAAQVAADAVRQVMWQHAGIDRTARGLRTALARLEEIEGRLPEGATEERNLVETARLIAQAALLRRESRGGHYRSDFPRTRRKWRETHIEW